MTSTDRDPDLFGLFVDDRRRAAPSSDERGATMRSPSHGGIPTHRDSPAALRARRASRPSTRTERGLLSRGAILDKYRIEALVGTGGFAAVYRATHLLLRVPVAIKLLRPQVLSRDPGIARQLLEEARYAARINHPNVVRMHDVTHTEEITYIVMEYIDGRSLAKAIQSSGPLHPAEVISLALDVAEGLRAGLEEGLIHRDIKPANILLTRTSRARIVDFGLAYAAASVPIGAGEPSFGTHVGTLGYMAPEQAKNSRRVDFRTDVYALGVTMLEALTGLVPSAQRTDSSSLRNVPAPLTAVIRRMTAMSPDDRPTSYENLIAALQQAANALPKR